MTLKQLTDSANTFADEAINTAQAKYFANKAIAKINIDLDLNLPFFDADNVDYVGLDDNSLKLLVETYITYGIKMNDGSLSEADRYLAEFKQELIEFSYKAEYLIDESYRNTNFGNAYQVSTVGAINVGHFPLTGGESDE